MHPVVPSYGLNVDAVPGYFRYANENHRSGIQLYTGTWIAFTLLAYDAVRFESEKEAEEIVEIILAADNGWLRPLVILPVYE